MAPHSSTLAWKIPWKEEPGGLQSMGSQRVGHDLETKQQQNFYDKFCQDTQGTLSIQKGSCPYFVPASNSMCDKSQSETCFYLIDAGERKMYFLTYL